METPQPQPLGQQPTTEQPSASLWQQYRAAVLLTARQLFSQVGTAVLLVVFGLLILVGLKVAS